MIPGYIAPHPTGPQSSYCCTISSLTWSSSRWQWRIYTVYKIYAYIARKV